MRNAEIGFDVSKKLLYSTVFALSTSTVCSAQDAPLVLEEITVTAERRETSLQDTAISVSVLDADELARAEVVNPTQLTSLVPSLQIGNVGGTNVAFFVRGVGSFTANSYTESAVAFNYDGVFIGQPSATSGFFYDLARVEVLKGPQGTLYGRNATGGAINVIPVRPELGVMGGYVTIGGGNYDSYDAEGAVNVPVGENSALRLSGFGREHDGFDDDGSNDADFSGARLQFLTQPNEELNARVAADYIHSGGQGSGGTIIATAPVDIFTNQIEVVPTGFDLDVGPNDPKTGELLSSTFNPIAGRTLEPLPRKPSLDGDFWGITAEVNWETTIGTLTIQPAYRENDTDNINTGPGFLILDKQDVDQTSLEVRLNGDSGRWNYLLGAFYYDEHTSAQYGPQGGFINTWQNFDLSTESIAAFSRLGFDVTKQLRITAGARYTEDKKDIDGHSQSMLSLCTAGLCPGAPLLPFTNSPSEAIETLGLVSVTPDNSVYILPGNPAAARTVYLLPPTPRQNENLTDSKPTYHFGIEFDYSDSSLLYAAVDTGFRSGGFSFARIKPSYKPEDIIAYSIGAKNRLFDERVQLNVEGFYWEYDDQQVSHSGSEADGNPAFFTENVGKSEIYGLELDMQYLATRNTLFSANLLYLDGEWKDFVYDVPATENPILSSADAPVYIPLMSGCKTSIVDAEWQVDCSGLTAVQSPDFTMRLGIDHTIPIGGNSIVIGLRTYYQTANRTGFDQLQIQKADDYWNSSADVTFLWGDEQYYVTAYVNNIEDDRQKQISSYISSTSLINASPTNPLTYGIRFGARF